MEGFLSVRWRLIFNQPPGLKVTLKVSIFEVSSVKVATSFFRFYRTSRRPGYPRGTVSVLRVMPTLQRTAKLIWEGNFTE